MIHQNLQFNGGGICGGGVAVIDKPVKLNLN